MSRLEAKLFAGERIVFRCRAHRSMFLLPVFLLIVAFINTFLPFLFAGLALLIFDILKYYYSEFIVTNERVLTQKGFFDKRFTEMALENI
ncbi:MAG TPA: hypothetical protein VFG39_07205, partial [Balneolaceae bacterium]|nr:hypothetical protein [Balneolaceae bacterium]